MAPPPDLQGCGSLGSVSYQISLFVSFTVVPGLEPGIQARKARVWMAGLDRPLRKFGSEFSGGGFGVFKFFLAPPVAVLFN